MKYKLKDIFDLQMGKTPSRNNSEYWNSEDYKWISIADLSKSGKYISDTKEYLSERAVEESGIKVIPANTVVMSFKLSIGKTAITAEDMYSNEAIMAFHDKHVVEILPEYIFYMFKYKNWDEGSNKAVMGKTLNKATLSEVEIEICPIEEQREIVNILDKMMSILDGRENELSLLDDLIKARFVEMFGNKGENPNGYEEDTLGNLYKFQYGKGNNIPEDKGEYPCYGSNGIVGHHTEYNNEDSPIIGHIGAYAGIVNWGAGKHYVTYNGVMCKLKTDRVNPIYGFHLLQQQDFNRVATKGGGQPFVSYGDLEAPIVVVPPIEVQEAYAAFAEQVNKSKVVVQKALDETQLLFNSLMQKYFG